MTRGEKLFAGTIASFTLAGGVTGHSLGDSLNDTTVQEVVAAGIASQEADQQLSETFDELPACARIILGTLEETGYTQPGTSKATTREELIKSQCDDESALPENLLTTSEAYRTHGEVSLAYSDAIDDSQYTGGERTLSIAYGSIAGWALGWAVAATGFTMNQRFLTRNEDDADLESISQE